MRYKVACRCRRVLPSPETATGPFVTCGCGRQVSVAKLRAVIDAAAAKDDVEPDDDPDDDNDADAVPASTPETQLEFRRLLKQLTPRTYGTWSLLAINVGVFVAMVASGVSAIDPKVEQLIAWGGNYAPQTLDGQWWRLVTSLFVHAGVMHLVFNMIVLAFAGPLIERMTGNVGFLIVYFVAGLFGALVSTLWHWDVVCVGASGAIFGLYGALLGILLRSHETIPQPVTKRLLSSGLTFIGLNIFYAMSDEHVDMAAHFGGLFAGFLCGVTIGNDITMAALPQRRVRNIAAGAFGALLVAAGVFVVRHFYADVPSAVAALKTSIEESTKAEDIEIEAFGKHERGLLGDAPFADLLAADVAPPFRASIARLQGFKQIPTSLKHKIEKLTQYLTLRTDGVDLFVLGLRNDDEETFKKGYRLHVEAQSAAEHATRRY